MTDNNYENFTGYVVIDSFGRVVKTSGSKDAALGMATTADCDVFFKDAFGVYTKIK